MEILSSLFLLIFNKIPNIIAEILLAVVIFPFRPYQTVIRTVIFAKRNAIPSAVFMAIAFTLFMIASGFSHPFNSMFDLSKFIRTFSDISVHDDKLDLFFVILYSLGLTTLVIFLRRLVEYFSKPNYQLLRDFYYISTALSMPWAILIISIITYVSLFILRADIFNFDLIPDWLFNWLIWPILFTVMGIATLPTLIFVRQLDRRWYKSEPLRSKYIRILSTYLSIVLVLTIAPLYLYELAPSIYYAQPIAYTSTCFAQSNSLFVLIAAENQGSEIKALGNFYIRAIRVPRVRQRELDFGIFIDQSTLFGDLKEHLQLKPHDFVAFRLEITYKDSKLSFHAGSRWNCSTQDDPPTGMDVYLGGNDLNVAVLN